MTEVLFYHLTESTLEDAMPGLLERSVERGWRAVVQTGTEDRRDALDGHLWTYRDDSFLAHATDREPHPTEQPILLAMTEDNPNGASVRFLIDGVPLQPDAEAYQRVVLVFDGDDDDAVAAARAQWTAAKERGFEATYWQPDDSGRWVKRA